MCSNEINVDLDLTLNTPYYWDGFWDDDILGGRKKDPDVHNPILRRYHSILWSRPLPNGDYLDLQESDKDYLIWNGHRFSSDSIAASFRYERNRELLTSLSKSLPDYHGFIESFIRRAYTIGGSVIFPKERFGINQGRGLNRKICDRWDLTLECIRRFYIGEESPLSWILEKNAWFFDLFVDFKGYTDFFFLQDYVSEDSNVIIWMGDGNFEGDCLPKDVDQYLSWIRVSLDFVDRRNMRIYSFLRNI